MITTRHQNHIFNFSRIDNFLHLSGVLSGRFGRFVHNNSFLGNAAINRSLIHGLSVGRASFIGRRARHNNQRRPAFFIQFNSLVSSRIRIATADNNYCISLTTIAFAHALAFSQIIRRQIYTKPKNHQSSKNYQANQFMNHRRVLFISACTASMINSPACFMFSSLFNLPKASLRLPSISDSLRPILAST